MKRNLRLLMVETINTNLGDNVIADTNCKLLRYAMFPRSFELFHYNVDSHDVEQIRYVDAVIFSAGILKTTNEKLWFNIPEIMEVAQRYDVPVFMSGIGAEPIEQNEKGSGLKRAVNLPCVKVISCRDDIECLKRDYLEGSRAELFEVYDSALWCKNTYKAALKDSKYEQNPRCIGLGIIRSAIFPEYGNEQITEQMQLDFWAQVTERLEAQGYTWKLFTNGANGDEAFAEKLLAHLGRGEKYPAPRNANELVRYIHSFGGIIAGRMHSNIIAYALGVPSVGLIWNKKLRFWGEKIGHPERFIEPDELDGKKAADLILQALKEPRAKPRLSQKLPSLKAYRRFLRYVKVRDYEKHPIPDIAHRLCAPSLGCIDTRYRNTNSVQALKCSLKGGYENYHANVRLTADKKPVLIKRWNADAYRKLGIERAPDAPAALTLAEFSAARYYNRFTPYKLPGFLRDTEKDERIKTLIFSFGRSSQGALKRMFGVIESADRQPVSDYIFCLERQEDIALYRSLGYTHACMYYPPESEDAAEAVAFCAAQEVRYLRVPFERYTKPLQEQCDAAGIEICVLNCEKVEQILFALQTGARFVGSNYFDVHYWERLLNG